MRILYTLAGERRQRDCPATEADLERAFATVQKELGEVGEVATVARIGEAEVALDPQAVLRYLEGWGEGPITLELRSLPVEQLARETAGSAIEYLDRVLASIGSLAERLHAGEPLESREILEFTEGLEWLARFFGAVVPFLLERDHGLQQEEVAALHQRFAGAARQFHQAFLDEDLSLMGDTLLYEFGPVLERLRAFASAWLRQEGFQP